MSLASRLSHSICHYAVQEKVMVIQTLAVCLTSITSKIVVFVCLSVYTHTHTHTFNGPFAGTTRVSRYQKGKTNLDFTDARNSEWQWHQLGHVQVCISLQTDNHASTPPLSFFTGRMPFLPPNQQRQSTEGISVYSKSYIRVGWMVIFKILRVAFRYLLLLFVSS